MRPPLVRTPKPGRRFQRKDTEQYHVCLGAPGVSRSDRRRFAASILDAILGGSASSRLFQEIREKRGMAYAVYSFLSEYADTGQIGVYVGTREDNLAEALAIAAEQIADIAAGSLRESELERAKENLKGRVLLSMESTSTHMNRLGKARDHRLRDPLARADRGRGRRGRGRGGRASSPALLLAPERLSAAGIGPSEERFLEALEARVADARARGVKVLLNGYSPPSPVMGKVGAALGPVPRARSATSSSRPRREADAMVDFTTPDAVVPNILRAVAAGVPCVVGTSGWDTAEVDARGARGRRRGLLRAELRDRRGADDALRGRGLGATSTRAEIVELHHATKLDAPSGTREGDRGRDAGRRADPLGAAAGPRRAPGGDPRRAGARRSRSATTRPRARRSRRACGSRSRSSASCRRA